ncbi:hypothetical protein KSF78_0005532 [Schistosoma japonicum]|nr:hypothetical protein KSF78_0005532 [Schistosoma japonicum]
MSPSSSSSSSSYSNTMPNMKCDKTKLQEIIERLTKYDQTKLPIESISCRQLLGFNRYDYGCSQESECKLIIKRLTNEEIHAIIERLTQYDIHKYPPESRGHEKKT